MNGVFYFSEGAFDTVLDEGLYFGSGHDVVRNVRFGVHFAGVDQFADFVYALGSENGCGDIGHRIGKVSRSASDIPIDDFLFIGLIQFISNVRVLISINTYFLMISKCIIKRKHWMPKRRLSSV
ncbi:hypothetical protein D3H55_20305 [Bacillus salacetis]|uniref:Uncharacterized protein n=1 Tax=Bacillus salacetis TaxID=2315464 RepID=A0A3A1QPC1_9BACI|nr:hypothetical protein [Bacillus salacetis]RIW28914.1 hypothetical protein D3H55_20305 [Bacillus salacetis]